MTDKPPIRIYVNKIENRIIFKNRTGYYLKLLTSETMALLGRTKDKMIQNENGEHVLHLGIMQVVLAHCNIFNKNYQHHSRASYTFFPNKLFAQL